MAKCLCKKACWIPAKCMFVCLVFTERDGRFSGTVWPVRVTPLPLPLSVNKERLEQTSEEGEPHASQATQAETDIVDPVKAQLVFMC